MRRGEGGCGGSADGRVIAEVGGQVRVRRFKATFGEDVIILCANLRKRNCLLRKRIGFFFFFFLR